MRTSIPLALALLLLAPAARADVVYLKNGRTLSGNVTREGDGYRLRTGSGGMFIPADQVLRVEQAETPLERYRKDAAAVRDADVEGHYRLARYCKEHGLTKQMREELAIVLALAPEHEAARREMGYVRHDGKWLTSDEVRIAQGYVKFRGKWITKAYKARLEAWAAEVTEIRARQKAINAAAARMRSTDAREQEYGRDAFVKLWKEAGLAKGEGMADAILQHYEKIRVARRKAAGKGGGMSAGTTTGGLSDANLGQGVTGGGKSTRTGQIPSGGSAGFSIGGNPSQQLENAPIPPVRVKLKLPDPPEM